MGCLPCIVSRYWSYVSQLQTSVQPQVHTAHNSMRISASAMHCPQSVVGYVHPISWGRLLPVGLPSMSLLSMANAKLRLPLKLWMESY